jgi:hypothetical protein
MISANCPSAALLASHPSTSSLSRTSAVASAASSAALMRVTTGCGVAFGTTVPNHGVTWASAKPCSVRVGTSAKYLVRPSLMVPMIRMATLKLALKSHAGALPDRFLSAPAAPDLQAGCR